MNIFDLLKTSSITPNSIHFLNQIKASMQQLYDICAIMLNGD